MRSSPRRSSGKQVEAKDVKGAQGPSQARIRHDRRRDREGLRRRGIRREGRQELPALGRDRRREPLRKAQGRARQGGLQPRQLGVFPAARDPDAARGALQRALLAQARSRPPRDGVRDGRERGRRGWPPRVLRRRDPLPRAHDLHQGRGDDRGARGEPARDRRAEPRLPGAALRAREARRDRLRERRDADDLRRQGQDRAHRARAAQRRASAHRGMHAGGQRERLGLPRGGPAAHALPGARRSDAREARGVARDAEGLRPRARRRRRAAGQGLRAAAQAHQGQALRRHAADGDAALALAGGVQPRERRPLRPRLRRVRALHLAHSPLSGSPRAPRHQGGARGQAPRRGRPRGHRSALLRDRAPRRRRHARRGGVAQELLHAGPRGRGVQRHHQRRDVIWFVRNAGRFAHRRPRAHLRPRPGLLPVRRRQAHAARRALGGEVPARRARAREGGAREPRAGQDRFRAGAGTLVPAVSQGRARSWPPLPRKGKKRK